MASRTSWKTWARSHHMKEPQRVASRYTLWTGLTLTEITRQRIVDGQHGWSKKVIREQTQTTREYTSSAGYGLSDTEQPA